MGHRGAGAAAVVVVLVVLAAAGMFTTHVLDRRALQKGVAKVLAHDFAAGGVQEVSCPAREKVADGNTFTCRVRVGGTAKRVSVTVTNVADAEYRVGQPH